LIVEVTLNTPQDNDHDRAIAQWTEAIKRDPNDLFAYLYRGLAYLWNGDHERAIADFDKLIALDPSAAAHCTRGDAYYRTGAFDLAIADYTKGITLDLEEANAYKYFHRGEAFKAKGDKKRPSLTTARRLKSTHRYKTRLTLLSA
jgi:tetratricopeptide (TPR) repeat protein